jgi:hypothetical protein
MLSSWGEKFVTEQFFIPKSQTCPGTILVTRSQVKLYVLGGVVSVSSWLTADHGMCRLMMPLIQWWWWGCVVCCGRVRCPSKKRKGFRRSFQWYLEMLGNIYEPWQFVSETWTDDEDVGNADNLYIYTTILYSSVSTIPCEVLSCHQSYRDWEQAIRVTGTSSRAGMTRTAMVCVDYLFLCASCCWLQVISKLEQHRFQGWSFYCCVGWLHSFFYQRCHTALSCASFAIEDTLSHAEYYHLLNLLGILDSDFSSDISPELPHPD